MFDKNLFLSVCEKYHVEFSGKLRCPMLKTETDMRKIGKEDIKNIFVLDFSKKNANS